MLNPVECVLAQHAHFSERLIDHASKDLTIECDGALANFLWVANVQGSCLLKFVLRCASFPNFLVDILAADGDLSTHSVLCLDDIFTKTVEDRLVIATRQRAVNKCLTSFCNVFEHDQK